MRTLGLVESSSIKGTKGSVVGHRDGYTDERQFILVNFSSGEPPRRLGRGKICGVITMAPHHFLLLRKSDGLQPWREVSLILVSLSFRFLGLCCAMISLFGITSPRVLLKIFL